MKTSKSQIKLISLLSVLTLVGCQQAGSIAVQNETSSKASQTRDLASDPVSDPVPADNYNDGSDTVTYLPVLDVTVSTERCAQFLQDIQSIDYTTAKDFDVVGKSIDVRIETARNVKIVGNSANIVVLSSVSANQMSGNSGRLFLNTGILNRVSGNSSDEICLKATAVGAIAGNSAHITVVAESIESLSGGSGDNRITANTIGVIEGNSSLLHIYKAKVSKVHGQSGQICLHDGAQIQDFDSSNSGHVSSNCQ